MTVVDADLRMRNGCALGPGAPILYTMWRATGSSHSSTTRAMADLEAARDHIEEITDDLSLDIAQVRAALQYELVAWQHPTCRVPQRREDPCDGWSSGVSRRPVGGSVAPGVSSRRGGRCWSRGGVGEG